MTSNDSMTSSTFQGIEKILMSYLSLIKQTGQVCWQTIDQATTKTPLEDLHYKKNEKEASLSCPSTCISNFSFKHFEH